MPSTALTVADYLLELPEDRREAISKLRNCILENIPKGFQEVMSYGMIGYVIPHSIHPAGYHCNPKLPVPFINIGSQKNNIVLHHLGIYGKPELSHWFTSEYPNYSKTKLDMGKGCIRFKNLETIPYELIGKLASKVTVDDLLLMAAKDRVHFPLRKQGQMRERGETAVRKQDIALAQFRVHESRMTHVMSAHR